MRALAVGRGRPSACDALGEGSTARESGPKAFSGSKFPWFELSDVKGRVSPNDRPARYPQLKAGSVTGGPFSGPKSRPQTYRPAVQFRARAHVRPAFPLKLSCDLARRPA